MFRRARRMLNRIARPNVPPMLRRANQFMANGDYANAESTFYELAGRAENKFPQHAPALYIQAGRAAILSNQTQKGIAHFRSGLTLLGTERRFARLEKIGNIILNELREHGLNNEADEIEQVIKNNLPTFTNQKENSATKKQVTLPTHCPSCGAIVNSNEVEWLDGVTAECDYCGSPIRAS
ncbi:MAG: hypothetical protein UZ14_CFX002000226 [Chloroflexi bacterium OLB14]|nr:MAG: hypothetical protein UZ14_CFX002000226 [Chloroflexi bacterium OLB14]